MPIKKQKKPSKKHAYSLAVTYPGFDQELDKTITKTVGRESTGSGFFFALNERDMSFDFKTRGAADRAKDTLSRVLRSRNVRARIERIY